MNVFIYQNVEQAMWNAFASEIGYEPKTTFYGDLSVAEFYGTKGIRNTYNRVMKEWIGNVEYITEFIMCLNHKIWEFYDEGYSTREFALSITDDMRIEISKLYNDLWEDAERKFFAKYDGDDEALNYYYQVTD